MMGQVYNWALTLSGITESSIYKMLGQLYDWVWKAFKKYLWQAALIDSQDWVFDFRSKKLMAERVVGLEYI